jgi:hypothetical protein
MFVVDVANRDDAFDLGVLPLSCAASDINGNRMFLARRRGRLRGLAVRRRLKV